MSTSVKKQAIVSPLYVANAAYLEDLYEIYLKDPHSVSIPWRDWFDQIQNNPSEQHAISMPLSYSPVPAIQPTSPRRIATTAETAAKQAAVLQLINAYRFRGHQKANIDPLHFYERPEIPDLDPAFYGLTKEDEDTSFCTGSFIGLDRAPLQEILNVIKQIYCSTIGAEYMHITETAEKRWIQDYLERSRANRVLTTELKHHILERLTAAEGLEHYLHTKYIGQKRFLRRGIA